MDRRPLTYLAQAQVSFRKKSTPGHRLQSRDPLVRALAVAYKELGGGDHEAEGNSLELFGLLAIFGPPREDTRQTIEDALAFC